MSKRGISKTKITNNIDKFIRQSRKNETQNTAINLKTHSFKESIQVKRKNR